MFTIIIIIIIIIMTVISGRTQIQRLTETELGVLGCTYLNQCFCVVKFGRDFVCKSCGFYCDTDGWCALSVE